MTDYTELKRLAEAFPADLDWDSNTEPFFNGPSGESLGGGATGFYCVYGKPFRLEGEDYDYDGPTYVEACPADFAKFMVAARQGVLSLIAENEELGRYLCTCRDCGGEGALHTGDWHSYGHMEPPEPVMEKCGECDGAGLLGEIQDLYQVITERDQLKTKNESLRSDIQSWRLSIEAERNVHKLSLKGAQDELDRLKGPGFAEELAGLRKNAARYQWLREARSGYIEVVEWIGPHATGMTGEDLDTLLDAAMDKGGRS